MIPNDPAFFLLPARSPISRIWGQETFELQKETTGKVAKKPLKAEFLFSKKCLKKQKKHKLLREIFGSQAHNCHHKIEIEFKVHLLKITVLMSYSGEYTQEVFILLGLIE